MVENYLVTFILQLLQLLQLPQLEQLEQAQTCSSCSSSLSELLELEHWSWKLQVEHYAIFYNLQSFTR